MQIQIFNRDGRAYEGETLIKPYEGGVHFGIFVQTDDGIKFAMLAAKLEFEFTVAISNGRQTWHRSAFIETVDYADRGGWVWIAMPMGGHPDA